MSLLDSLVCVVAISAAPLQQVDIPGLSAPVEVYADRYSIPHLYAKNWVDASRALGYLHASDRLFQMEVFRRLASGRLAELLGKDALPSDLQMRRLGIRRSCEEFADSGLMPREMVRELNAYVDGVNTRIKQADAAGKLPSLFKLMGAKPAPWTVVDSLVFSKYMAWDQSGTNDDLWCGMLVEKLGPDVFEELFPIDRPYEEWAVDVSVDRKKLSKARLEPIPGAAEAYEKAIAWLGTTRPFGEHGSFGSNNWAVDGTKSATGKPILCSDPHLDFKLPSIWYAVHLAVDGKNVAGATFAGSPVMVIGHNDHHAWGITNMQADAVDYFVETVDPKDPSRYQHLGEWRSVMRRVESIAVKGEKPHELVVESTIHGPIISRDNKTIAMSWTGLGPTPEPVMFWKLGRLTSLKDYLSACDLLIAPSLNLVYADVEGNIAMYPCGALPARAQGAGRIPMEGASGKNDWNEMIPRDELPLALNPKQHFVASANGRPAGPSYSHYLGWMWDPGYRVRRIHKLLKESDKLTMAQMKEFQYDAHDLAAERFVPVLLKALRDADLSKPSERAARDALASWNFVASPSSPAPLVWVRWFPVYRDMVWQDDFAARKVIPTQGSWGFNGQNRREPPLEVLEKLTLEQADSHWFDDVTTPARESRDEILRKSFVKAIEGLEQEKGADPAKWTWGTINRLAIASITGLPPLARQGGPVPGTPFTLNPGSNGGTVGGGASWRMIVDLAKPSESQGVYPGGQREDASSPHYKDLMPIWEKGEYVNLNAFADPRQLPKDVVKVAVYSPAK